MLVYSNLYVILFADIAWHITLKLFHVSLRVTLSFHFSGWQDLGTPSLSAFGTLTIDVDDIQDVGPMFINTPYDISIPETQQVVSEKSGSLTK